MPAAAHSRTLVVLAAAALAGSWPVPLAAQEPAARGPLPMQQSLALDVAAALNERWRLAAEPLVFGRFTLGFSAAYERQDAPQPMWAYPLMGVGTGSGTGMTSPPACMIEPWYCYGSMGPSEMQRTSTRVGAHLRWYPRALSFDATGRRVGVYLGEFLEHHRVRRTGRDWYLPPGPWPMPDTVTAGDSVIIAPPYPYPYPYPTPVAGERWSRHWKGFEPGLELGARMLIGRRVMLDVGTTARVITVNDPYARRGPGAVDKRFAMLLGIAW